MQAPAARFRNCLQLLIRVLQVRALVGEPQNTTSQCGKRKRPASVAGLLRRFDTQCPNPRYWRPPNWYHLCLIHSPFAATALPEINADGGHSGQLQVPNMGDRRRLLSSNILDWP